MFESMVHSLKDFEVELRSEILNIYPNTNIVFTNDKDEDGRIVYIDVAEVDKDKFKKIKNEINSIADKHDNELISSGIVYTVRRIF